MRVVCLTVGDRQVASSRLRVYQFVPLLEEAGFRVEVIPARRHRRGAAGVWSRRREELRLLQAVAGADVVLLQKRLFRAGFVGQLRRAARRLVYDFDDAVFLGQRPRSLPVRRRVQQRFRAVVGAADLILAGNRWLAQQAGHPEKTAVLPTAVDMGKYSPRPGGGDTDGVTVGWIGSSVNFRYLEVVAPVLARLAGEALPLRLRVVADRDFSWPGVEVENRLWSEEREAADIAGMDIGIMPLEPSDWARGKCAYKALQYMACAVPAVCTAFGAVREIIRHGENGFLCSSAEEWAAVLRELAADVALRHRIGQAGRRTVAVEFSLEAVGGRLVELLSRLR